MSDDILVEEGQIQWMGESSYFFLNREDREDLKKEYSKQRFK